MSTPEGTAFANSQRYRGTCSLIVQCGWNGGCVQEGNEKGVWAMGLVAGVRNLDRERTLQGTAVRDGDSSGEELNGIGGEAAKKPSNNCV